jgi:hypothetical protein
MLRKYTFPAKDQICGIPVDRSPQRCLQSPVIFVVQSGKGTCNMPKKSTKKNAAAEEEKDELEGKKFQLELRKLLLEEDRSWFEFHKHMTTLNTGVIIIVATLVEKVFTGTAAVSFRLITLAFYSFLGSITISAIGLGYHMPSLRLARSDGTGKGTRAVVYFLKYAKVFLFIASLMGFLLGIFFFIAFALSNNH